MDGIRGPLPKFVPKIWNILWRFLVHYLNYFFHPALFYPTFFGQKVVRLDILFWLLVALIFFTFRFLTTVSWTLSHVSSQQRTFWKIYFLIRWCLTNQIKTQLKRISLRFKRLKQSKISENESYLRKFLYIILNFIQIS